MEKIKVGFALTGSFCTFAQTITVMQSLVQSGYEVFPIMSGYTYATDTRFGRAASFVNEIEGITGHKMLHTIEHCEPVGPNKMFDILVVAPCTGNTLAKLANGVNDTSVTMACKSHLRNQRPLLLAVSSNDALSNCAKNIGVLLNSKNVYFVPMKQDNPDEKPRSVVADFESIQHAITCAMGGIQMQPIFM